MRTSNLRTVSKGTKFGRLTLVEIVRNAATGRTLWRCGCECGSSKLYAATKVANGATSGCGCGRGSLSLRHGMSGTATHKSWIGMRFRCSPRCPKDIAHRYYGRGIRVCARWESFENFLADMGEAPPGLEIDRWPDNDGNYEPGNCRWATTRQNTNNRCITKLLSFQGLTFSLAHWAVFTGIGRRTLWHRIFKRGWDIERALTTPERICRAVSV